MSYTDPDKVLKCMNLTIELKDKIMDYHESKIEQIDEISHLHFKILKKLDKLKNSSNSIKYQTYIISTLNNLFQLTLFTRDKYYGMGSRNMFNIQFYNYVLFYEKGLIHEKNLIILLQEIVSRKNKEENIGCWKDLRELSNYLFNVNLITCEHPVMDMICDIYVKQIKEDYNSYDISWCAKWIPREKSKHKWMVPYIVNKMFNINTVISRNQYYYCLKKYRQMIASLNKRLDTPEIHMCYNMWERIEFKDNSDFFNKHNVRNLLNYKYDYSSPGRIFCSKKYYNYLIEKGRKQRIKTEYLNKKKDISYKNLSFIEYMCLINEDHRYPLFLNFKY